MVPKLMPQKNEKLLIYEKLVDLLKYSKNLLNKYPKSERFDICTDIKRYIYDSIEISLYAWRETDKKKRYEYLNKLDIKLFTLKALVRISLDSKYISIKNFMVWNEKIGEIGKMVGGWMKKCQ